MRNAGKIPPPPPHSFAMVIPLLSTKPAFSLQLIIQSLRVMHATHADVYKSASGVLMAVAGENYHW